MMDKIGSLGGLMAFAGIASTILSFMDYNLRLLMWVDMWGPTMGWVIRGGLVAGGVVLFIIGKAASSDDDSTTAED